MQQGRDATEEDEDCQPLNSGITPLQCAAAKKNLAVAQYLLSEGADVEQASPEGWTALHYAAAAGHACVIHLLKQHGAVLSAARRVDGLTPLSMAAAGGHADVVYLLLESGASPEELDFDNWSSLHYAVAGGSASAVRVLLSGSSSRRADPEGIDLRGWTPLHHAANTGNDDTVRLLLPYVRNANIQDYDGWTALHHAVASGCRQVVERLLLAGVDTEQRNMRGLKPAELTADVRIQRLLRKRRQPPPQQVSDGLFEKRCCFETNSPPSAKRRMTCAKTPLAVVGC